MQMTSNEAFESLKSKKFDLVYIDGDHSFEQAKRDIKSGSNIVKLGGYLCRDDLELQAHQVDIKRLKRHIFEEDSWGVDPKIHKGYHPSVTLADVFGQVSEWGGFWAIEKTNSGWRNIELSDIDAFIPRQLMQYDHDGNQIFDL